MSGRVYQMENPDIKGSGDAGAYGHRSMGNGRNGNGRMSPHSPLKKFGQAKKQINKIFKDIKEYFGEVAVYVEEMEDFGHVEGVECADKVKEYREKVSGITEVLARDHMKVVFFGRTSNGKSTTINALIREKLLPTGIGHTTNCFLQVEGSDTQDGYLLTEEEPDQPKSVQSIKHLASALSNVKLKENSLIRILWPKTKCRLLLEDVVLVDSPGIDITPDLDLWIDKFCVDADVFVFVSNAESTLTQAEKNFFHKVSAKLSKPNLFILNNRWDISAFEDDVEEVKQQHLDREIHFLCNELKVVADKKEGNDRVFFVSSREVLHQRLKEAGTPTPTGILQEGYQERMFNFANFERLFEECISSSAVRTKFEQHTDTGKLIVTEQKALMEEVNRNALQQIEMTMKLRQELADELDYIEKQLSLLTTEIKDKIKAVIEDVERKVSTTLNDEIDRLAILVDEYDRPFHADHNSLILYKKKLIFLVKQVKKHSRHPQIQVFSALHKPLDCSLFQAVVKRFVKSTNKLLELHKHVEEGLGKNVQAGCSATLINAVEASQKEMTERFSALLPEEARQQIQTVMPKREFDIAYHLDRRNLCSNFSEEISFHFSLSPMNLFRRMMELRGMRSGAQYMSIPGSMSTPMTPQEPRRFFLQDSDNEALVPVVGLFCAVSQKATIGGLIVTGIVYKAVGWKILAVGLSLYGGVFCYERLTWTTKAKEHAFKQQYVDHVSSKLKQIVDLTSANCSDQVKQELSSTFARLCNQADISKEKLTDEIRQKDLKASKLQDICKDTEIFKNKTDWLDEALDSFREDYC